MIMVEFNKCKIGNKENNFESSYKSISHSQNLKLSFLNNECIILLTLE